MTLAKTFFLKTEKSGKLSYNAQNIILAGGHVRACAGDLVVHGALIPCVCVSVCLCVRYQTPFSSRHES